MMRRGIRATTVLLAAAAIAMSGCGGGGSSTVAETKPPPKPAKPAAPPISKPEFLAKARGFCTKWLSIAERKALGVVENKARLYIRHHDLNAYKGSLKRQELATMLAPALNWRLERLRSFGLPKGDEARAEEILKAAEAMADTAEENPFGVLSEGHQMRRPRAMARAYGIESCALLYRYKGLYERGSANPGVRLIPRSSK